MGVAVYVVCDITCPLSFFCSDAAVPQKGLRVELPLALALCSVTAHGAVVLPVLEGSFMEERINRVFKRIFNFYLPPMVYYQLDDKMS